MDIWTRNVFSVPSGSGSGFIWDDAGHVITNFHVIQGATEARVKLSVGGITRRLSSAQVRPTISGC